MLPHLDQMRHWFHSSHETLWVDIEAALAPTHDLLLLLLADILAPPPRYSPLTTKA